MQLIVSPAIFDTGQPLCVHSALNALNSPLFGWVMTALAVATIRPLPTGTSLVLADSCGACCAVRRDHRRRGSVAPSEVSSPAPHALEHGARAEDGRAAEHGAPRGGVQIDGLLRAVPGHARTRFCQGGSEDLSEECAGVAV